MKISTMIMIGAASFGSAFPGLSELIAPAWGETFQPLFHGVAHDCDGPRSGGHVPIGFMCKGAGTGLAVCSKPGDKRLISIDVQTNYCHIDVLTR